MRSQYSLQVRAHDSLDAIDLGEFCQSCPVRLSCAFRGKHGEPQSSARARSDVADMYHDEVVTKVRSNLDSTMVAAVHG